jgi:hypothetical protein
MKKTKLLFLLLSISQNTLFNEEPMILHEQNHEIAIKCQNQLFTLQQILSDIQLQIDYALNSKETNLIQNTKKNTPYASPIWLQQSIQMNFAISFAQVRFLLSEIIEKDFKKCNISSLYLIEIIIIFVGLLNRNDLMQNLLSTENYKKCQSFHIQINHMLDHKDSITKEKMQEVTQNMEEIIKLVIPHLEVIYPDIPSDIKNFSFMSNKDILQFTLNIVLLFLNNQKHIMLSYLFLSIGDDTFSQIRKQSLGDEAADTNTIKEKETKTEKNTKTKKDTKPETETATDKNNKTATDKNNKTAQKK